MSNSRKAQEGDQWVQEKPGAVQASEQADSVRRTWPLATNPGVGALLASMNGIRPSSSVPRITPVLGMVGEPEMSPPDAASMPYTNEA